jgi:hypothetical protein
MKIKKGMNRPGIVEVNNVVANWQKFWPQNTKVAELKLQGPEKSAAGFL